MDLKAAKELGIKTVIAGGLPGKLAPVTAGENVFSCIMRDIEERWDRF